MAERHWWKAPSRMRRSRGFGIHSPFAYDLVQNTLRERLPYYIYDVIDKMQPCHRRNLRLLVRLVCRLRPAACLVAGEIAPEAERVITCADSRVAFTAAADADMLIVGRGADVEPGEAAACLGRGGTVVLFDKSALPELAAMLPGNAMTFSNGRIVIAAGRRDLPRQSFELNF